MKKILFAALVFFFAGFASYSHDNSGRDKHSPYHEVGKDGGDRERSGTR